MADQRKNFAVSSVALAPSPPNTGTSLTVKAGQGARFATPPFNMTLAPEKEAATPENAEIVRVTGISGDVFTIVREQEGTIKKNIESGWRLYAGLTDKVLKDIEGGVAGPQGATGSTGATGATGPAGTPGELALGVTVTGGESPRTILTSDGGKSLDCESSGIIKVLLPQSGIPIGYVFEVTKIGSGEVIIELAGTAKALPTKATYKVRAQGSVVGIRKRNSTTDYIISGDFE